MRSSAKHIVVGVLLACAIHSTSLAQEPSPAPTGSPGQEQQAEPSGSGMGAMGGQGTMQGGPGQVARMQGMQCTCPSAMKGATGVVVMILGALLALAATAALLALTVFLIRRSRPAGSA